MVRRRCKAREEVSIHLLGKAGQQVSREDREYRAMSIILNVPSDCSNDGMGSMSAV